MRAAGEYSTVSSVIAASGSISSAASLFLLFWYRMFGLPAASAVQTSTRSCSCLMVSSASSSATSSTRLMSRLTASVSSSYLSAAR